MEHFYLKADKSRLKNCSVSIETPKPGSVFYYIEYVARERA